MKGSVSILDYPNTEAGTRKWRDDHETARKRTLAHLWKALPLLRASALPCPFCGNAPKIGPTRPDLEGNAWGFVKCINGRCAIKPEARDGSNISDERGTHKYIALAIRRWNRRAATKGAPRAS